MNADKAVKIIKKRIFHLQFDNTITRGHVFPPARTLSPLRRELQKKK